MIFAWFWVLETLRVTREFTCVNKQSFSRIFGRCYVKSYTPLMNGWFVDLSTLDILSKVNDILGKLFFFLSEHCAAQNATHSRLCYPTKKGDNKLTVNQKTKTVRDVYIQTGLRVHCTWVKNRRNWKNFSDSFFKGPYLCCILIPQNVQSSLKRCF